MLERIGGAEMAYLCLDNDNAGRTAAQRMADALLAQGVQCTELLPRLKDWNDILDESISVFGLIYSPEGLDVGVQGRQLGGVILIQ